jgi:predicted HicB family RNase H-like nuclease
MMQYKGYTGKVDYDPDANILHGEVLGIRDVVTFQAKSVEELQKAFRESIDDYLAFCRERGEQPERPSSGKFVVRIDPELHRKANIVAAATGKSLNSLVGESLAKALDFPQSAPKKLKRSKGEARRRAG